ncbi:MAG: hypothetical protein ABL994_20670, partial [Verrucomicrobiales bacterium]
VLERHDLDLVQFERDLTHIDSASFVSADFVVTGDFRIEGGGTHFRLLVARPGEGGSEKIEGSVPSVSLVDLAVAAAAELADNLINDGGGKTTLVPVHPGPGESARFATEAERALTLGFHRSAAKFAETALLLDSEDEFGNLYLLSCAGFLSSFPALRGKGVSVLTSLSYVALPGGSSSHIDFLDLLRDGKSPGEPWMPDRDQWSAFALAAERSADMARLAFPPDQPHLSRETMESNEVLLRQRKFNQFSPTLWQFLHKLFWETFDEFRKEVPEFEREMLMRIFAASVRESPAAISLDLFDAMLLAPSPDHAINQLRDALYGAEITALGESASRNLEPEFERAYYLRHRVFAYFEQLGFDGEDTSSNAAIDERFQATSFVSWLSGNSITFESAFATACKPSAGRFDLLCRVDDKFRQYCLEKPGKARDRALDELKKEILQN